MNLNLRQLDAFVRVARLGGFSRAAEQMHLSQAGLSILVRKLEERLGLQLFERTTRSVALTADGRNLLPIAERLLQDAQAILHSSERGLDPQHQRIALALPPLLAATMLPGLLQRFRQDFPRVSVAFRECVGEEQISRLYSRDVDFALGFGHEERSELECRPLGRDYLSVAHLPDHPLAKKSRVRWSDLVPLPVIVNAPGSGARTLAEQAFAELGESLTPVYETSNHITSVSLAREGLGVAIVSSCMHRLAPSMQVALRTLHGPLIARAIQVVRRRGQMPSAPAEAFVALVTKAVEADMAAARVGRRG
jgi:LysR family carnitine catabolism transcriptional activator